MKFTKRDNFYQVSWISGPRHNLLAISLTENDDSERFIRMLPPIGECRHNRLDETIILAKVVEGIDKANQMFNLDFRVSSIEYVENDTPPEEIYEYLTLKIVEHLVSDRSFDENI